MKDIAHRLNAYIEKHPFDSGDSDCETVLDQLYQAKPMPNPMRAIPQRSVMVSKNWKNSCAHYRWMTTTQCSISAAACAAPTNARLLWTVCNMGFTCLKN